MLLILLVSAIALLFVVAYQHNRDWRISVLEAAINWGVILTFITEILSIGRLLVIPWVAVSWWITNIVLLLTIWQKIKLKNKQKTITKLNFNHENKLDRLNIFWLVSILFLITTIGIIALIAPPNTADSMTYHMSRVMHWQQNQSVAHYPTHIGRQIYQNPWAEFAILHLQILTKSDRFANLVQWFSMVGSLVGISLIAQQLGAKQRGQILATLVAASVPMGILQASSTQNDYVVSFWVICFTYYVLLLIQTGVSQGKLWGASASMGLALLTKATGYIYVFPLLLWLSVCMVKRLRWQIWQPLLTGASIVTILNLGHYWRNFSVYGAPLAAEASEPKYTNEIFSLPVLISNILRNISLHVGSPVGLVNAVFDKIFEEVHKLLPIAINDPRTTYTLFDNFGIPGNLSTIGINATENNTSNTLHLLLIFLAIIIFFSQRQLRKQTYLASYLLIVTSIFLLFCFLLKWQWWHSRLHLPIFLLFSVFIGVVLAQLSSQKLVNILAIVLILYSLPWALTSRERPLISNQSILTTDRIEQYFVSKKRIKNAYREAAEVLKSKECNQVGLKLGYDDYEYPFWVLLNSQQNSVVDIEHVEVTNTSKIQASLPIHQNFVPCAIVSTQSDKQDEDAANNMVYQQQNYQQTWSSNPVKVYWKIDNNK